jgi:molybdopterin converting factor subunit 1
VVPGTAGFYGERCTTYNLAGLKVRLLFFAVLRDVTGVSERSLELPPGTTAADVWRTLREEHSRLRGYERPPLTAINEQYASPEAQLRDGDDLAFIPPVSGG